GGGGGGRGGAAGVAQGGGAEAAAGQLPEPLLRQRDGLCVGGVELVAGITEVVHHDLNAPGAGRRETAFLDGIRCLEGCHDNLLLFWRYGRQVMRNCVARFAGAGRIVPNESKRPKKNRTDGEARDGDG